MNKNELQELLKQPVCLELKHIFDRGSDGCFTVKENETFGLLTEFIRNTNQSLDDRFRAVYHYDDMMGCADEETGAGFLALHESREKIVADFIKNDDACKE